MTVQDGLQAMKLQELKDKTPADLLAFAEELEIENATSMRKQDMMFAILKALAEAKSRSPAPACWKCCRTASASCARRKPTTCPAPTTSMSRPSQIRRFGLRTGDTVEGAIRAPREGERYFALVKVTTINFEDPENVRHKVHFDNLTPLYPDERAEDGDRRSRP